MSALLVGEIFLLFFLYGLYSITWFWFTYLKSPLRLLPGPPSNHWYFGWTTPKILNRYSDSILEAHQRYGKAFHVQQFHRTCALYVIDEKAINFVLNDKSNLFGQAPEVQQIINVLFGKGTPIVSSEGQEHRKERKVLQPAFTETSMKIISKAIFTVVQKSIKILENHCSKQEIQIDMLHFAKNLALDIIGLAAFNSDLGALEERPKEVQRAFLSLIDCLQTPSPYFFICLAFPWLRKILKWFVKEEKQMIDCRQKIEIFSKNMFSEYMNSEDESGTIFSCMKMIDEARIQKMVPAILIGGFETNSSTLSWAFHALTCGEEGMRIQQRLRSELYDQLNLDWQENYEAFIKLPYLDAVCMEILRMYPVAIVISRICLVDTVIPLNDPITLSNGQKVSQIEIAKGNRVCITPQAVNRSKHFFGEKANEFIPERWLKSNHPWHQPSLSFGNAFDQLACWKHLITFGKGNRMCIGYKFALEELKITLALLIKNFQWSSAIDPTSGKSVKIEARGHIFMKPCMVGLDKDQFSFPIRFKTLGGSNAEK